jgi:hypothetical protein
MQHTPTHTDDALQLALDSIALLESDAAVQLIAQYPKDGSQQSLTDHALQTTYLRGQLEACKALREMLSNPSTRENES